MFGREKKAHDVIGIHVGRTSLTIARIVKPSGPVEVRQLFRTALPRALSAWPMDLVRAALVEARKQVTMKAERIHLTLPSDLAPSYFFVVPSLKGEQLDNAVKLQLENKWGNQCGELSYQFQMLEKRGEQYRMFAASMPLERLRLVVSSFAEINCPIDLVEVEGVSVSNLVSALVSGNSPVAVLHLCSSWGEIHVLRRDRVALSRPITRLESDSGRPEGGDAPPAQAEPKPDDPAAALGSSYLERICREANKTLDYFEIELLSPAVERLFLIGEAASAPGLADLLARQLELKVEILDTGDAVSDSTGHYEPTRHGLAVAVAAGEGGIK